MPNDLHIAQAMLGRDAEDFARSEVGRYVLGRCQQEIDEAQQALAVVSPWRRNRIRQLQNTIWRAQSVRGWIAGLIAEGRQAEAVLQEDE